MILVTCDCLRTFTLSPVVSFFASQMRCTHWHLALVVTHWLKFGDFVGRLVVIHAN